MKKATLVQGIQTIGLALIVISAASVATLNSTNIVPRVLSDTTSTVMSMYVYYGEKTIKETGYTDAGFPNIVSGGGSVVRVDLNPLPTASTTISFTTNEGCTLFNDAAGGGVYGLEKTDTIQAFYTIAIGAVDDAEYQGERYCKVLATLTSSDAAYNGQLQKLTFTVQDNDPKPEGYQDKKALETVNKPSEQTTVTQTVKLAPPTAKLLDKSGSEIASSDTSQALFKEKEPIYLKGTTIPNGKVNLYIFSEPQTATVTANDEGEWAYTITTIEPGEHRVEIEVTDPVTGETSERQQVLAFQVAQNKLESEPISTEEINDTTTQSSTGLYVVAGVSIVLLVAGILTGIIWKNRHPHQSEVAAFSPEDINNNLV